MVGGDGDGCDADREGGGGEEGRCSDASSESLCSQDSDSPYLGPFYVFLKLPGFTLAIISEREDHSHPISRGLIQPG